MSPAAGSALGPRPVLRRIHHRAGPRQGTVVCVHGTLDSSNSFRRAAEFLPHWTVIGYDRRGWGSSRDQQRAPVFADQVQDLVTVLTELDDPPVLVGHSYGGSVALTAAADHPEAVRGVVAFEPSLRWLPWWPDEAPWEALVREVADDPTAAARRLLSEVIGPTLAGRQPAETLAAQGRALLAEMLDETLNQPTFDPLVLDVAATIGAGERSLNHHIEVSERLADLLPHGHYVQIPAAGHAAHVTHPEEFAGLVRRLVD